MDRPKIKTLFLCTGNSARSQMAEGLLRYMAGDLFEVYSAGLDPKGLNPFAILAMDELGIDIRGQRSKSLREYMGFMHFGWVITVCANAEEHCPAPLWANGNKEHWPFDDPAAGEGSDDAKLAAFRTVRDQIKARLVPWIGEVRERFDQPTERN
ncbi:MAG: arsenate reductase ArsC [Chloroflexi bacterium]|nr:arsenate reductase ArsC [Chloroflexota bacterium]